MYKTRNREANARVVSKMMQRGGNNAMSSVTDEKVQV